MKIHKEAKNLAFTLVLANSYSTVNIYDIKSTGWEKDVLTQLFNFLYIHSPYFSDPNLTCLEHSYCSNCVTYRDSQMLSLYFIMYSL